MTVVAAESFIRRAIASPELVRQINCLPDNPAVEAYLIQCQWDFDFEQFQQACTNLLVQCQIIEQAEAVREMKLWWECMQLTFTEPAHQ